MTTEELYESMEDGNLGYACVFKKGDQVMHTDYMFKMTAENIANLIGKNAYSADRIIMMDMCDRLICESVYDGFLMNCPVQTLCRDIIPHYLLLNLKKKTHSIHKKSILKIMHISIER